jgi:iron complex transport system substrate-binding protein
MFGKAYLISGRRAALAATLVLAVVLAACGGSDGDGAASAGSASAGSGSDTVTVEHMYGSTEVPVGVERIVSLDTQWTDVLAALDRPPVGHLADQYAPDGYPWRGDALADATLIEASDALPYEAVAALDPDLIVVTYLATSRGDYEKLSAIAPTIPLLGDREVDTWQDLARTAGRVLGAEDAAEALVEDVASKVAAVAADLPGLGGKTFALANYVPGDAIYVVADPTDGSNVLFEELGLGISPTILAAGGDGSGRVKLSLEQTGMLDGDVLVLLTNGAKADDIPGYAALPAVRSGAVAVLDYADVVGLNTPTPLSVPYSLERIRPALAAAATASG